MSCQFADLELDSGNIRESSGLGIYKLKYFKMKRPMSKTLKWFKGKINVCVYTPVYLHMQMRRAGGKEWKRGREKESHCSKMATLGKWVKMQNNSVKLNPNYVKINIFLKN